MSDLISRQAAIEEIQNTATITSWYKYESQEDIVDKVEEQLRRLFVGAIESLPSESKTGKWEYKDLGFVEISAVCSECGYSLYSKSEIADGYITANYCQYCGARMVGDNE